MSPTLATAGETPDEVVRVVDFPRFYELQALEPTFFGSPMFDAQLAADIAQARVSWLRQRPDDAPDFVVMIRAWGDTDGVAFYQANRNDTAGLGLPSREETAAPWQGAIYLGALGQYDEAVDGIDGLRFVWAQELGHRWGVFVGVDRAAPKTDPLRGRAQSHWSYFVDTDGSALEGNDWIDHGDGTFTTDHAGIGTAPLYSLTDLYLMGLVPARAVPDFFVIEGPQDTNRVPGSPPEWRAHPDTPETVRGTRRDVSIDDLRTLVGPRTPTFATSQRAFRVAVLVMSQAGAPLSGEQVARVDALIEVMTGDFLANARGLAAVEIAVVPPPENLAPVVAVDIIETGRAVTFDASASSDSDGALTFVWEFGDEAAAISAEPIATHTFATTGRHTVTVVAIDPRGGATTQTISLRLDPPGDCGCRAGTGRTFGGNPGGALAPVLALVGLAILRRRQRARLRV